MKYTHIEFSIYNEDALKSILEREFGAFSSNKVDVTITYTNDKKTDYVIDYVYLYNGFKTNSGYSIIVQNGVITQIRDNTLLSATNISERGHTVAPEIDSKIIQSATAQANEEVRAIQEDYCITEQYGDKYYSIEEEKYYYRVNSVYMTPEGGYGAICTMYEL